MNPDEQPVEPSPPEKTVPVPQEILEAEELCRSRKEHMKTTQEIYKSAKAGYEEAVQDLHRVIRELSQNTLFNQPDDDGDENKTTEEAEQEQEALHTV